MSLNDKSFVLRIGTYHIIVKKSEVPFFDELKKTGSGIIYEGKSYLIYDDTNIEVLCKIDRLLSDEKFRNTHINYTFVDDNGKEDIKHIKDRIIEKLKNMNNTYQGFYNFHLVEEDNKFYIVDENEEFYYGGQDFDNCLESIEESLKTILNDKALYLECEIPARWIIVSDKLNVLINNCERNMKI